MKNFIGRDSNIHNIARGLLVKGDDIVLCHTGEAEWFFLPGGHIEDGESAKESLLRELDEELVEASYEVADFIGVCESIFELERGKQHEINLVFEVNFDEATTLKSAEDHIEFITVPKEKLADYNILPSPLHKGLLHWLKTGESFFKEL